MPSLFRRRTANASPDTGPADATPVEEAPVVVRPRKGYTPSKRELGKITPKRRRTGRVPEPPPANRREAIRRAREKNRKLRAEIQAGRLAGKEEYLLPRDKGPERALTRDVVDVRRNAGTLFLPSALLVMATTCTPPPIGPYLNVAAILVWVIWMVAATVDSVLLCRRVRDIVLRRYPRTAIKLRSLYYYAIMRSLMLRRWRIPRPRLNPGDPV